MRSAANNNNRRGNNFFPCLKACHPVPKFPNAVILNAVGRRNKQQTQKSTNANLQKSTKRKRAQKSAKNVSA